MKGRKVTCTGNTIEQAKSNACRQLNLEEADVEFEIIQEPGQKKFGIFETSLAKVIASEKVDPFKSAYRYLNNIIDNFNIGSVEIDAKQTDQEATFNITGENLGALIGYKGTTIQAIQYLTNLVANKYSENYFRINIDIGNYKKNRENVLRHLATSLSYKVLHSGDSLSLEPMNPYERRIIHTQVQKINGIKSWSEGEGNKRHVIIGPDSTTNTEK